MNDLKKVFTFVLLFALALQNFAVNVGEAAAVNTVIINEIAWAGSSDSSGDEWIELYNAGSSPVDLAGWYLEDDVTGLYLIESGEIKPYGYFLIEDSEGATSAASDALISLSLANSGDSLILKNAAKEVMDSVNSAGAAWAAGNNSAYNTMERIDPAVSGDLESNWADSKMVSGGTPGSMNTVYGGVGAEIALSPGGFVNAGSTFDIAISVGEANDLYAYGFELNYDSSVINFVSASEGEFLKSNDATTAFNAALADSAEGKLLVGNARLLNPASGISGDGKLFTVTFKAVGEGDASSAITLGATSFISDSNGDVPAKFGLSNVTIGTPNVGGVSNAVGAEGVERYQIALGWDVIEGASYVVKRQAADLSFVTLGTVSENSFVDKTGLIPNVQYTYQVIAVVSGVSSDPVTLKATDTRGIKGDIDRSDRVDGRDIEQLARSYGSAAGESSYDVLKDTTFDGMIDGSDLIDIGANFGLSY